MEDIPSSQVIEKVIPENDDNISVIESVPSQEKRDSIGSKNSILEWVVDQEIKIVHPGETAANYATVEQISSNNKEKAETDDKRTSMNEWTGMVMTMNVVETQIEAYERTSCELNNDDRAKYEE